LSDSETITFAEARAIVGRIARPIDWVGCSPDGAQRNPGPMVQVCAAVADYAALHPGYVLSQIGREEKAAAADKVSPIVRHRESIAQPKAIAAARRWVSRSLSSGRPLRAGPVGSTHPTGCTFSFLFDRQSVRAYVYSHAFGLFSILVELITEHGDDDD
jgi:hypothetical protein